MPAGSPPGSLGGEHNQPDSDSGTSAKTAMPPPTMDAAHPADAATPPAAADPVDAAIEALDLSAVARKAAYALKKAHPTVTFTSGKRSVVDQARAMAGNVVSNRKWIEQTYKQSVLRTKLQKWVDDNPDKKTKDEINDGLLSVFNAETAAVVGAFSKHLSGDAFDVQPVTKDADDIKKTIRGLEGLDLFLEKEGGLERWHAQF